MNNEDRYTGKYCENCQTCASRCQEFKDCVKCQMYKSGPLAESEEKCASKCTLFESVGVPVIEVDEKKNEFACTFYDEDGCRFQFVYTNNNKDNKVEVRAQQTRDCTPEVSPLGTVLGVVSAIVFTGLFSLSIWRLTAFMYDRREFKQFERERTQAKWKTVTTTSPGARLPISHLILNN